MNFIPSQEVRGNGWRLALGQNDVLIRAADLRRNETLCEIGYACLNGLSESDALNTLRRFHGRLDRTEASLETKSLYPFGGEALIKRSFTFFDQLFTVCVDIQPGRGETVKTLELEPLTFPGSWSRIEAVKALPQPGSKWELETLDIAEGETFTAAEACSLIVLTDENQNQIEVGIGSDYWRDRGQGDVQYQIIRTAEAVTVKRRVLAFTDENLPERRPWRFSYYLAFGSRRNGYNDTVNDGALIAPDMLAEVHMLCRRAPAARRYLRKLIRQQISRASSVTLQLAEPVVCDDAGHLERPGKKALLHWDMDELIALQSWGCRTLGETGLLRIIFPADSIFRQLPSGRILARDRRSDVSLLDL